MKTRTLLACAAAILGLVIFSACKDKPEKASVAELPDLNTQSRPYVTLENTKVRTGPGDQFRIIGEIKAKAKVHVVGRDGDWLLIVSKKGNAPGYIDMSAAKPATGEETEAPPPPLQDKYEILADTQVRSGPGLHYPEVAKVKKGMKINVVHQENGWLKVESKHGNPPGYVEESSAKLLGKP